MRSAYTWREWLLLVLLLGCVLAIGPLVGGLY